VGGVEEAEDDGRMLRGIHDKVFHQPMTTLKMGEEGGKGGSDGENQVEGGGHVGGALEELEFECEKGDGGFGRWWRWERSTGRWRDRGEGKCGGRRFGALLLFGARAGRLLFLGRHLRISRRAWAMGGSDE